MSHKCKSVMFHCMDFRLINETRKWMSEQNLIGDCDVVSVAGSSKSIVDGSSQLRDFLLGQIATAVSLHGVSQVILLHHSDCGAYRSAYIFASPVEEKFKQSEDMDKAQQLIENKFPNITVMKIWAQMQDSDGNKVEFSQL